MPTDLFVKLSMFLVFAIILISVGIHCKKNATDVNHFILGGRSVGPWLTAFSYGTSYFSAVVFVGYAGQFGWKFGISATWTGIANSIIGSYMAWVILGRRTRVMTQHLNSSTMPNFFEERYSSKFLRFMAAIIIFIFMIPYTASLYNGLSRLFEMAFHVDYSVCVVIMALLTGIYVIAGGYMASAINDFIQGIIMLFSIVAIVVAVLNMRGGLITSLDALARVNDSSVSTTPGIFASFLGPDPFSLLGVLILTSLGTWGLPQMVQKFYAIKNEHSIDTGTVISTIFALVVAGGCYFLGGFGRLFSDKINIAKDGYDSIIPTMLNGLPSYMIAIVIILVFSASMSTLSALVLTSSSTMTLDFLNLMPFIHFNEKKKLVIMRYLIAVFIIISAVIAIIQYKAGLAFIAQLMSVSWGAMAGAFLAPFLYGLYWKKTTAKACAFNFIFATLLMISNILFRSSFPAWLQSPINAGAFCMLFGFVLVPFVSLFTKSPDKKKIEHIFSCYDRKVTVSVRNSIESD